MIMRGLLCLCLAAVVGSGAPVFAAGPQVEVLTLQGETLRGDLQRLDARGVELTVEGEARSVAAQDVLEVGFADEPSAPEVTPAAEPAPSIVRLVDGSELHAADVVASGTSATVTSQWLGKLSLELQQVREIRFGSGDAAVQEKWDQLRQRDSSKDLLVIYKGDSIDFVDGVVAGVSAEAVTFLLDGEEIPVNRQKVYGVIFDRDAAKAGGTGSLLLQGGDRIRVQTAKLGDGTLEVKTPLGVTVSTPLAGVQGLDFREGRIAYLSELTPRTEDYTPFFDTVWRIRRNRNFDGGPLRLAGTVYDRGVCIHSKTLLRYRLAGDYRKFQAVMGIDDLVARGGGSFGGTVEVSIKADDRVLFEGTVTDRDEPRRLDFDVSGVRDLEILVDFGSDTDVRDHLDLADARLLK